MNEIKMLTPKEIITTISNKKTGEIYKDEEALKAYKIVTKFIYFLLMNYENEYYFFDFLYFLSHFFHIQEILFLTLDS